MTFWGLVLAIHILCIVIWVGGMFFALIVLRPSLSSLDPAPRVAVHNQVFRRFFLVIWHVMPIALITGYAMLFGVYGGFAGANWAVQTMQGLGLDHGGRFPVRLFRPLASLPGGRQPCTLGRGRRTRSASSFCSISRLVS